MQPLPITGWFKVLRVSPPNATRKEEIAALRGDYKHQYIDVRYFHDRSTETVALSKYAEVVDRDCKPVHDIVLERGKWYRAAAEVSPVYGRFFRYIQSTDGQGG